jgi:hypothetical protein
MVSLLRWWVSILFVVIGTWAILANWVGAVWQRRGSLIPVVGSLLASMAIVAVPLDAVRPFWWVPLILDLGCVPLLLLTAGFLVYQGFSRAPE